MKYNLCLLLLAGLLSACGEDASLDEYTDPSRITASNVNDKIEVTCIPPADVVVGNTTWEHKITFTRSTKMLKLETKSSNPNLSPGQSSIYFSSYIGDVYPFGLKDINYWSGTSVTNNTTFETKLIVGFAYGALVIGQASKNGNGEFGDTKVHCIYRSDTSY